MIDPKNSGVYAPINKIIVLNYYPSEAYKLLLNEVDKYNEMSSIYLNSLLIIDTMIHEINHAILFDEIEKGENSLIHELVRKSSHVLNRKDFNSIFDYFANDK